MKFNVLNDGTILTETGVIVGSISVNGKYKDSIIASIECAYDASLINDIISSWFPDTSSHDYAIIEQKMEIMGIDKVKENYSEIVSYINYYR